MANYCRKVDGSFYETQAWGALEKCWRAFKIANSKGDIKNVIHYAEGVRKFQKQLGLEVKFSWFGLYEKEDNEYDDTKQTPDELELSNNRNQDDIEVSYDYLSEA